MRGLFFTTGRRYRHLLLLVVSWLLGLGAVRAQAPNWDVASAGGNVQANGYTITTATAVDAAGNVVVVGYFLGQVAFGNTVLVSVGSVDIFVAKWVPATNTWAWALRGGGTDSDQPQDVVVSGGSIYVSGSLTNTRDNRYRVELGGQPQAGTGTTLNQDLFVAKFTEGAAGPVLQWVQLGGGTGNDEATSLAVQGSSVYVAGRIANNTANAEQVLLGGSGQAAGTLPVYGATATSSYDLLLAKFQDNGASATAVWAQVGGGTGSDYGQAVAVSGTSVYLTGYLTNSSLNDNRVVFGGGGPVAGTAPQAGVASPASQDIILAKYTDNGSSATFGWSQVAGGAQADFGTGVAAANGSVYVLGSGYASASSAGALVFGGSGTTAGTVRQYGISIPGQDIVLAKYQDLGAAASVVWTQVAGGKDGDKSADLLLSGPALYVLGLVLNDAADSRQVVFGGSGAVAGTHAQVGATPTASQDLMVARYTDAGASATLNWTQVAGGTGYDQAGGLGLGSSGLAVGMQADVSQAIRFDGASNSPLFGAQNIRTVIGLLQDQPTAGAWQLVGANLVGGDIVAANGVAADGQGNVYITGFFRGSIMVGSTQLSTLGGTDMFVAKYVPATNTWPWAVRLGGAQSDAGYGVAVSGNRVYVTGMLTGDAANSTGAVVGALPPAAGPALPGASATLSQDVLLAAFIDNGLSVSLAWTQVAGGTGEDVGLAVAANGPNVYLTGYLTNNAANANAVVLGGTRPQYGAGATVSGDMVLAKYTDNGPSASFRWSQVAGGSGADAGRGLALSGSVIYVVGNWENNPANSTRAVFGGSGTVPGTYPQYGVGGGDMVLARYTDNGTSATFDWSQVGGGSVGPDNARGVAVQGNSVYVAATFYNNTRNQANVVFGGSGTTPGTVVLHGATPTLSIDLALLKYTDQGNSATLTWTQTAGGTAFDNCYGVAVRGNAVFVAGNLYNDAANSRDVVLGGSGTTTGTLTQAGLSSTGSDDILLARYTDQGSQASVDWARVSGGNGNDYALGLALAPTALYATGWVGLTATFGSLTINTPGLASSFYVAGMGAAALPTRPAVSNPGLTLFPNPAAAATTLTGAAPGQVVRVLDALGRLVATATADAAGSATLGGLAPGIYVVRAGSAAGRLAVE